MLKFEFLLDYKIKIINIKRIVKKSEVVILFKIILYQ